MTATITHMQPPGGLKNTELTIHLFGSGFVQGALKLTAVEDGTANTTACDGVIFYDATHVAGIWSDGLDAANYGVLFKNGDGSTLDTRTASLDYPSDGLIEIFEKYTAVYRGKHWGGVWNPLESRGYSYDGTQPSYPARADKISYLPACPVCGVVFDSNWHPIRKGGRKLCRICVED